MKNSDAATEITRASKSNLAFAFMITPSLLVEGVVFAMVMGVLGGFFPAVRAARLPVATALREL